MSYDPYGQPGSDPRYPQYPQYPQQPAYPQQPQSPQYPEPQPYPQSSPYPQSPPYGSGPSSPPSGNEPTAPIVPSYGGYDPYGGGSRSLGSSPYGGSDPYGGSPYGQGPYGGAPSSGWPPPPGSVPPGSVPPYGPPPRKSRTGLTIGLVAGGVVLVLCLGGLAVAGARLLSDEPASDDQLGVADPGNPGNPGDPGSGDPFADTPAASFAEGTDGIQLPEAQAAGDFSAGEIEEALGQVRDALVATRVDETMLLDHDPEPFVSNMSPDNQEGLRKEFTEGTFAYFATQIAGSAELALPVPRVDGTITFEATTDSGGFRVIEVVTSFVWAYAFVVPDDPDLDGIVVVRDELVWQVAHPDDVADSSLGLWLWEGEAYASGIDCDAFDESLLAPQTEPQPGAGGAPDESDIYDPQGSLDFPDTC